MTGPGDGPLAAFGRHRGLLFRLAYDILGSVADVEDVLQDTWLRWAGVEHDLVADPRAYLARIVTRQALNRLRSTARARETYPGPWLPEPLPSGSGADDQVLRTDDVSVAMLLVLETLSPEERAVFVLREAFDVGYEEIAGILDRPAATVRQIAHRARAHVRARRPRFTVPPERARRVAEAFVGATLGGDLDGVTALLAPDVVSVSDGGGRVSAARHPVHGRDRVARFLVGLTRYPMPGGGPEFGVFNGLPGVLLRAGDAVDTAFLVEVSDVDGADLVTAVYAVRNPDKLAHL
ncbi:RNA polymerase sigma factor SigJ [Pseudonocardia sp. HH130630-07]|uniref:RNA polymerase sigma factor SigJ n=1 Tax=Pseudonocardia sp. HH130630-07 TaxID=1690815 RepID=UPI000814F85D|nr:RNA polymerase sigma factor SigJ [Pseudonocardia sp. HH130630-07]ANY10006.1 RNA polymerase subunit sigma-24 [Pseudonocardia sp. HH130630-07]